MKDLNHKLLGIGLKTLAGIALCVSTWQLAQAIPQKTAQNAPPYRATSIHDAQWLNAHPHYKANAKRGWIKTLPHRYRVVKYHNQTYYYSHNVYYKRTGNGYIPARLQ